jgi:two-component system sensor histidine kinase YesM
MKHLALKKLGSVNIVIVVLINLLLPLITHIMVIRVLHYQLSNHVGVTLEYVGRVQLLAIVLVILILAVIDFIFLIKPIVALENTVREHIKIVRLETYDMYELYFADSSIEKMFYDMVNDRKKEIERQNKVEMARQETEIFALQRQINPHFLYNTLDSIRGLALVHGVPEIADIAKALSKLFQNTVEKEGRLIRLKEELDSVENYVNIQKFRFENRFEYSCEIEENLSAKYMVPNLTLQPIVENGIMHGLEGKLDKGTIRISGYTTESRLIIKVYDNGVGIEDEKLEEINLQMRSINYHNDEKQTKGHFGIALSNINRRLKLKFGGEYGIYLYSTLDVGTMVEITLPLIEADEGLSNGGLYE